MKAVRKSVEYFFFLLFSFFFLFSPLLWRGAGGEVFAQTTATFNCTGSSQSWTVPPCVFSIDVSVAGAQGGGTKGGKGATVTATLAVTPGQVLQINVGCAGSCPGAGYNGGAAGQNANTGANGSCGGGGASNIGNLIIAAGGGGMGGGNTDETGGVGGCASGGIGTTTFGNGATGGTQTAGGVGGAPWISSGNYGQNGSLGQGGAGATDPCYNQGPGGGGGGGYYGGGGGGSDCYNFGGAPGGGGGGGGGSSLVPSGGGCTQGSNSGNGLVTITYNASSAVAGTVTAVPTTICSGQTTTLTLTGSIGTIQWQNSTNGGATWTNIGGATSATYTTPAISVNTCYRAAVTGCGTTLNSNMVCVTVTPLPVVSVSPANPSICSAGSISLTASGATTYSWSPGTGLSATTGATVNANPASTTTYTVTGTTGGCTGTASVTVTVGSSLTVTAVPTNINCTGANNGSINMTPGGGTAPYTYQWSNSAITQDLSGLSAGTYNVTVTDNGGCSGTGSATITQPASPLAVTTSCTNESLPGANDGASSSTPSGGTTPYTYQWSNTQTTQNISGLTSGTYTVTVTDFNGCTATASCTIVPGACNLSATAAPTNATCNGANNGSATINASGGITPYSYTWSPNVSTSGTANNLSPGTYSVTVSDGSCTASGTELVTNADFSGGNTGFNSGYVYCNSGGCMGPEGTYSVGTNPNFYNGGFFGSDHTTGSGNMMVVNGAGTPGTNVWCETITVTPGTTYLFSSWVSSLNSGSPAILQFSINGSNLGNSFNAPSSANIWSQFFTTWNSGANTSANICIVNQNTTLGGNDFGLDDISFKACNSSCTATTSFTISQPTAITLTPSQTDVLCFAAATGSASVNASGGTTPYSYTWTSNVSTTNTAGNLVAGVYTVTLTDANNCAATQTFSILQPAAVDITLSSQSNVLCFGQNNGSINTSTNGGTGGYTYQWTPNISNTSSSASALFADVYHITVTDANNCKDTLTVTITEPPVFSSTSSQTNVSCFGGNDGTAAVAVAGGSSPYSYLWDDPAATAAAAATGLSAGIFNVTATDANGCTTNQSYIITQPAAALALSPSQTNVLCNGGNNASASVAVTGGTSGYTFVWNPAVSTTANATNLIAGIYSVTVTDTKNCTVAQSFTITEPAVLSLSVSSTDITCNNACNGTANATLSGGVTPYNYVWSPAPGAGQGTASVTNLCPNNYTLSISDSNSCTASASFIITEPSAFTLSASSVNCNCNQSDGNATVTVTGATTPYVYLWDANANNQNTATASNIKDGNYCVTITDANGCDTSICVTVGSNPPPTATATATVALCNGDCNGNASVTAMGGNPIGNPTYTYLWSNTQTQATIFTLCAATYTVTVTDGKNCTATASATVTEPSAVTIAAGNDTLICVSQTAALSAVASGGNGAPYTFTWDNGFSGPQQNVQPLADTCYSVSATDAQGCPSLTDTQCVTHHPPLNVTANATKFICFGDNAIMTAAASGGDGIPYTYNWSDISGTNVGSGSSILINPPGVFPDSVQYVVKAEDNCSPPAFYTVTIRFWQNPTVKFIADTTFGCDPLTVTFTNQDTSQNAVSCLWNFGDMTFSPNCAGTVTHNYSNVGTYSVQLTITDANSCVDSLIKTNYIQVNPNPTADFSASPQPTNVQEMLIEFTDKSSGVSINQWNWVFYDNDQASVAGTSSVENPQFNFSSNPNPADKFVYFLEDSGEYAVTLSISTQWGCKDSIRKIIKVDGVYFVNIPNAFTPNGDGINDVFFPVGVGVLPNTNFNFYIFNRWGDMIFESHNLSQPWDGTSKEQGGGKVQEGVYIWRIDLDDVLGERHKYIGKVAVLWR